jgi:hypothetical protein
MFHRVPVLVVGDLARRIRVGEEVFVLSEHHGIEINPERG